MKEKIEAGGKDRSKSRKRSLPPNSEERVKRRVTEVELLEPAVLDNSCKRVTRSARKSRAAGGEQEDTRQEGKTPGPQDLPVTLPSGQVKGKPQACKSPRPQDLPVTSPPRQAKGKPQACESPRPQDLPVTSPPRQVKGKPNEACNSVTNDWPTSPPLKEPRVTLEQLRTPEQARVLNESLDSAPSPMTPWLPEKNSAVVLSKVRLEEKDSVPSPQGMCLPQRPPSSCVLEKEGTQKIEEVRLEETDSVPSPQGMCLPQRPPSSCDLVKEATQNIEEVRHEEVAVDDSLSTVVTRGLDLDGLIDEIFVKNSSSSDKDDHTISLDISSFDLNLDSPIESETEKSAQEPVPEPSIWSQTTVTEPTNLHSVPIDRSPSHGNHPRASCPVATDVDIIINSETASCPETVSDGPKLSSPAGAHMQHPNAAFSLDNHNIPQTNGDSTSTVEMAIAQSGSAILENTKSEDEASSKLLPTNSAADVFHTDEHFSEELTLSDSQYLVLDEKCSFLKDGFQALPLGSMTAHDPATQREPITTSSLETPSTSRSIPNLGFTVPPAPCMDWVQKTLQSRQRLRTMVQEISRLNAMVLRARRTMWPRQIPNTSQNNYHAPDVQTVPQRDTPQIPDLSKEPEWNIS